MLTRKCSVCGKSIEVSLPYSKQYIYRKPKWYHLDCFTATTTPRTHTGDWITKTADFVRSEVSKDNICQLFYSHYNISCISTRLFKKLDEIYKGTYIINMSLFFIYLFIKFQASLHISSIPFLATQPSSFFAFPGSA